MRRIAHLPTQLGITAVLAIVLSFVVPVLLDRHEYAKAVVDYAKNPNSENETLLRVENAKNQRIVVKTHIATAGVLFVLLNAGCLFVGRFKTA